MPLFPTTFSILPFSVPFSVSCKLFLFPPSRRRKMVPSSVAATAAAAAAAARQQQQQQRWQHRATAFLGRRQLSVEEGHFWSEEETTLPARLYSLFLSVVVFSIPSPSLHQVEDSPKNKIQLEHLGDLSGDLNASFLSVSSSSSSIQASLSRIVWSISRESALGGGWGEEEESPSDMLF